MVCIDDQGNNLCHYVFERSHIETRYKFLEIILKEQVGDIRKPNIQGQLPHDIELLQPMKDLPEKLMKYFPGTMQELHEADYLIITPQDKEELVLTDLEDLGLYNRKEIKISNTQVFNFHVPMNFDFKEFFTCGCKTSKSIPQALMSAIAIRIPMSDLSESAEINKI